MKHIKYLSQWKKATAVGSPKLSARLICGLVNALIEAVHEIYAVLMVFLHNMGHISAGCPEVVINLHDEMSHVGLEPDSLSYNILISACIKTKKLDVTMPFNEQLKDNGQKCSSGGFHPDIFTYATLLMGFRHAKDLQSLLEIVFEMKSCCNLILDRSTFTAMVDALLYSGSIKVVGLYALCIFGEIVKRVCSNPGLWPKPHLYVSMMHELAARVDYDIVKSPYRRMWPDSTGTISPEVQEEAGHLLMEAALNDGQALRNEGCYSHRGLIGVNEINVQPIPTSPVEEARPLPGTIALRKVVMRLFRDPVVPIVDDYCCTVKPAVRSIGHVIDLILAKRHKMVVVVKCGNLYGTGYSSTSRAVGFLTS
ncbi:pentatricopeptide repeat-containing protein [Citrus sinensis]|uniref:Pentatricopeptide repeat-containing protein n=1 Tax=Citrus sinensis TaxID=2711 RepID=A0ACB8NLW6_CITSI|nr:pentatricopeptide repeat-containing protein [Citrus sinensis]